MPKLNININVLGKYAFSTLIADATREDLTHKNVEALQEKFLSDIAVLVHDLLRGTSTVKETYAVMQGIIMRCFAIMYMRYMNINRIVQLSVDTDNTAEINGHNFDDAGDYTVVDKQTFDEINDSDETD